MKKTVFLAVVILSAVVAKGQSPYGFGALNQPYFRHFYPVGDSTNLGKKWFVSQYAGLSAGLVGFNAGRGSFVGAPVGATLYRQLNKTLYGFADLSVAPSFLHYSSPFYQPLSVKNNGMMNFNNFGTYTTAQLGLMYVNPERTFSISGSIGVSRYDGYMPGYVPENRQPVRTGKNY